MKVISGGKAKWWHRYMQWPYSEGGRKKQDPGVSSTRGQDLMPGGRKVGKGKQGVAGHFKPSLPDSCFELVRFG